MKSYPAIVAIIISIILATGLGKTSLADLIHFTVVPPGDAIVQSHCNQFTFDFEAAGDAPITYFVIGGPGSIDVNSGLWSWSPSQPGDHSLTIRAFDTFGFFSDYTCTIVATNQPPFFTSSCWTLYTAEVGESFMYTATSIDPDPCDIITYSITASPFPVGSIVINPIGLFVFDPALDDVNQTFAFEIIASDDFGSTGVCHIDVFVPDHSPVFTVVIPGNDLTGFHCSTLSFDFEATGGGGITYGIVDGPGFIDESTGLWSIFPPSIPGDYFVTISATNAFGIDFYTFTVHITNTAPIFTYPCGIEHTARPFEMFSTTFTAIDFDQCDVNIFSLDAIFPGPMGVYFLSPQGVFFFFPEIVDAGQTFFVIVSVNDSYGGSTQCQVAISVMGCGDADASGTVDISDVVYLIAYIFSGGPAPNPLLAGDADCSANVDISDAVYLIQYIFQGGPAPCAAC